jgi:polar amino acid transport system substrate-binding protein
VVTFSLPYYFDGTALVTTNAAIRSLGDLGTETIAALDGSSAVEALRYRWPNARLVEVRSYYQAQTLLETGQVAAFAGDASVLSGWVQEFPQYRLVLPVLTVEPLCIGLPKGIQHDSLRQRINQILEQWYKTGWLKERASYWGLPWDTGVEQRRDRP